MIIEYFSCDNREYWLEKISECDWGAGKFLHRLLTEDKIESFCGKARVFLLTDNEKLVSFCTFSENDDIPDTGYTPWVGFVYTFPEFRGKRRFGELLEHIKSVAKAEGIESIYISSREMGLYEKYGAEIIDRKPDVNGEMTPIRRIRIL